MNIELNHLGSDGNGNDVACDTIGNVYKIVRMNVIILPTDSTIPSDIKDPNTGVTPAQLDKIKLLGRKSKIEAIKLYRSLTDKGLRESHNFCNTLDVQWYADSPIGKG